MNLKGCRASGTYSPQACRGAQPLARSWQERYRACMSSRRRWVTNVILVMNKDVGLGSRATDFAMSARCPLSGEADILLRFAQQLRQLSNVGGDAPALVTGQALHGHLPDRFILEIDVSERRPGLKVIDLIARNAAQNLSELSIPPRTHWYSRNALPTGTRPSGQDQAARFQFRSIAIAAPRRAVSPARRASSAVTAKKRHHGIAIFFWRLAAYRQEILRK
jgi:hypothetical protein